MNIHDKLIEIRKRRKKTKMKRRVTDPIIKKFAPDAFERLNPEE
jgi:hypothetical protein